ncbi:AAA family ATPase [Planctomicrobium sp. SH661]|uniref:AAA family ATPase n=1 Tax=Planctomicrobium sp. SH661 TaxID=3448124 RepID=UPI003F5C1283
MQLRDLEIDRFGVWQDVTFPFNHRGVTVLYGPNEAGKSTLMRFIRGVLYGFLPQDERSAGPNSEPVECSGTLRLHHQGQDYRIRRTSQPGTRGRLEINGRFVKDDDPVLRNIVGNTPEAMFQNIFAIGLNELQQLATLNGDDVSRHIYGLSLGPEGEQIFRAHAGFAEDENRIIGSKPREGSLFTHVTKLAAIDKELSRHGPAAEKYTRLQGNLHDLEDELASHRDRQSMLQDELRGRQFLTRIWGPWKKERELQKQLALLPQDDIDREILNQFDQLELQLSEIDDRRKTLIAEAKQHQADAEAIPNRPELEEHACQIQSLFERSRVMQGLDRSLQSSSGVADPRDRAVQELLGKLDGRWDVRRLEQTEVTGETWRRLTQQSNAYRHSVRSRARLLKRYKHLTGVLKKLQAEWKSHTKELGDQSIGEARKSLQRRLHELEELRSLRTRRDHLKKTLDFFNRDLGPKMVIRDLPPFFWVILSFFTFAGIALLFSGIYAAMRGYTGIVSGGKTAWIVGGCFTFLGVAAMSTFWAMKEYFETVDFEPPESGAEREALEHELHRVEQAIERVIRREHQGPIGPPGHPDAVAAPVSEEEQIKQLRQQLVELDQHEPMGLRIDSLRRRLSQMRLNLQDRQRQLGRARRDWTEALRRVGLTETLKVSEAFEQCQLVAQARDLLLARNSRSEKELYQRQELEAYHHQIRDLAGKLEERTFKLGDLYEALANWDRELKLQGERRRERLRLKQSAKEKRHQSAELVNQVERLRRDRTALLKRLGVGERGEIIAKLAAIDERNTVEFQLKEVRQEIQKLVDADSDLAIVEDDLIRYDADLNSSAIEKIRHEQKQLEGAIQTTTASLDNLRRQLHAIEEDRTLTSLRFDREQIVHALQQATENWAATRLADKVVDRLRRRIEQDRQPQMLQAASSYLKQFTCGKYHRIWTRLGEKALFVDDDQNQSLRVEHLSSGTREQVFLSVRLAMIRDFARKGIELPMVLDDVTVNFDQTRTEAAAHTLMEVAQQGQQILLLTCHLHFAQIFQQQGHEPIWLPALRAEAQLQR